MPIQYHKTFPPNKVYLLYEPESSTKKNFDFKKYSNQT